MENPVDEVVDEIRNWLENRGYGCRHIFVVDRVFVNVSSKISAEDLKDFKNDFGHDLDLEGVSFDQYGQKSKFEYRTNHDKISKFKSHLNNWLDEHSFPWSYTILTSQLSLHVREELTDSQIHEFEEEFGLICREYSMECSSQRIEYTFG